jgi:hypothetical protein
MAEIRQVTQVLIFKLVLNNIQDKSETATLLAVCTDRDKLIKWVEDRAESWEEPGVSQFGGYSTTWSKSFRKGSELEWFNPPGNKDFTPDFYGHGIHEEWISEDAYRNLFRFIGVTIVDYVDFSSLI